MSDTLAQLAADLTARVTGARFILGVTGPPGSGKSTFAQHLAEACLFAAPAIVVAMDGFHYPNSTLDALNLRDRKGSPETFDVAAFTGCLRKLRDGRRPVTAPVYDRTIHDPVPRGVVVPAATRLVIVEGNYLLLEDMCWTEAYVMFDEVWHLDTPLELCLQRIRARHIRGGLTPDQADAKITVNDHPNAELIAATAGRADRIIRLPV